MVGLKTGTAAQAEQYEDHHNEKAPLAQSSANVSRPGPGPPRMPFPLDIPLLNALKGKRVILASKSPRRKQLLGAIGLRDLEITPSEKPENLSKTELSPFEYVHQTAQQKCLDVYQLALENSIKSIPDPTMVISADTVIVTNTGRIVEKPRSEADHIAMLKMLRDQVSHKVYTAVCVLCPREDCRAPGYNMESAVEETKVVFDETLGNAMIEAYVKTREAVGMAGGYGIQGMGSLFVKRIEGSFDNVVGLPVRVTMGLMETALFKQGSDDGSADEDVDEDLM